MPLLGRDHEGFDEIEPRIEILAQPQQHGSLYPVDLVDGQCHPPPLSHLSQPFENTLDPFRHPAVRFDEQDNDIGIRRAAPRRCDHCAIEPAAGLEEPGRIHKDDLAVTFHRHTADARARCLHLVGHDTDFRPDHAVQEGRFPCVRLSDQGDESGTGGHWSISSFDKRAAAAACSAARLDGAVASASCPSFRRAAMVKTGA